MPRYLLRRYFMPSLKLPRVSLWQHFKNSVAHHFRAHGHPRSSRWPQVRRLHLQSHPFCAACGGHEALEAHHIAPFHLNPLLELDPENLITLCRERAAVCHLRFGHGGNFKDFVPPVRELAAQALEAARAGDTEKFQALWNVALAKRSEG